METTLRDGFKEKWGKYFGDSELPITFFYSDDERWQEEVKEEKERSCVIGDLARVRKGKTLCYDADAVSCFGGKRYLGYSNRVMPNFEYFLSCGIPGKVEGERYKKSPEVVKKVMEKMPEFAAPGKHIIFKRWDKLADGDEPQVVIFFAKGDVLAGLYTLAGFRTAEQQGVIAPFGAGCSTIVQYPYLEIEKESPRAILGNFDVSARPYLKDGVLSLALPVGKLAQMYEDMDESFLITDSWKKLGLAK